LYADLYLTRAEYLFAGVEGGERGMVAVYGVPFDSTSSFRAGQREGPIAVRRASANIESNGYVLDGIYIEDVGVVDVGDVAVVHGDAGETLERVRLVTRELARDWSLLAGIGGEHLVTLGALAGTSEAMGSRLCAVVFDAHFDLRDEYLGLKNSHATVFKRALDHAYVDRVFYVGVRAWSREERDLADSDPRVDYVTARMASLSGPANVAARIRRFSEDCQAIYVSVDVDVLDPGHAPGVANPEPGGMSIHDILEIIASVVDERVVGVDVVEVSPPHDCGGVTAVAAAKILQEALLASYRSRRAR